MQSAPEESEIQFLRTYKDYIYLFNMLERNIVYCLWHANRGSDVDRFSKYSFDEKARRLERLVKANGLEEPFGGWLASVERCRKTRNRIVHGSWEFRQWLDKPIRFHIPAPVEEQGELSMGEFVEELEALKKTANEFSRLRRQYELVAPLPKRGDLGRST